MLITTTAQMKEFAGGIQANLTFDVIRPFVENAESIVVGALLGTDFLAALAGDDLDPPMAQVLRHAQRAIALTALHESMVSAMYQYGNSGLSRFVPKDAEKLTMWEVDVILSDAASRADQALEQLMGYLETHQAELPAWRNASAYQAINRNLIPSAGLLAEALPEASMSYRLFAVLKGYMPGIERKHVAGVTGPALLEQLKQKLATAATLSDPETELWRLSRDLLAPLTLWKALPFIQVRFFPDGVRILQSFKGLKDEKAVDQQQITQLRSELLARAEDAKGALQRFLNQTASATVFPLYFNSGLYVAPGTSTWKLPDNEGKKHFRL
ncbi:hypothetical protein GCM10028803_53440 [Larkinella knui]|uniref:Uncharacterized protein n=1 Tax=Larkinella knui TaxID=2025310 RepID=A0A3P1CGG6_9BACT|nr:DUF6712 family protein [Larkinella knui]RRB12449.1 hypothetical protein EHT87_19820 [Larkinella knui]